MDDQIPKSKKRSDTSKDQPHEALVFFVDRCLGRGVCEALRAAGFTAEHKDDHFPQNTADEIWLPEVGKRNWVVLTRDTRIRLHPNERLAILAADVRFFTLQTKRGEGGRRGINGREMQELILANMEKIERMARETPCAFIAGITRTGVRLMFTSETQS
jgi:hypothetical protein